jgi:hypothetical protein
MHNVPLPKHRYVWVDDAFVAREPEGKLLPAVWFGISSHPGRAFGCHVLLECGATVIDLPLHCLRWKENAPLVESEDELSESVAWDSFGWHAEIFESSYLAGLDVRVLNNTHTEFVAHATAWFAIDWLNNGWSDYPEQHKWLWVVAAKDGRLMAVPQDKLLFEEVSFTDDVAFPNGGIKRQTQIWSAE